MEKKITKKDRERLIGLLPFSIDATEQFTPKSLDTIPDVYKPIFTLKPWNMEQRNKYSDLVNKLTYLKEDQHVEQMKKFTNDSLRLICEGVVDVDNLLKITTDSVEKVEVKKENGHIEFDFFLKLPEGIKSDIRKRVFKISGLITEEKESL